MKPDYFSRILHEKKSIAFSVLVLFVLILGFFIYFLFSSIHFVIGLSSYNSSLANLTIWDITDSLPRFAYQNCYDTYGGKCLTKSLSEYNIFFYANFTNQSSGAVITPDGGNCSIRFDENLSGVFTRWINMTFSVPRGQYEHNRSFNYKGKISFEIDCPSSEYSTINLSENATISNSAPAFHAKDAGGNLPTQSITEDTMFYYNVSLNCSDDDLNDIPNLAFDYITSGTNITNFTLSAKGNLTVNISTDGDVGSGSKKIMFSCSDSEAPVEAANMSFTITAVNDAPLFVNLNDTINATESQFYNLTIQSTDEEHNYPLNFNVTFVNCTTASWSSRNSVNCNLFNFTRYNNTAILLNFTPTNNDVGNYTIEFNVTDLGNTTQPHNATRSKTIIFGVSNVNNLPTMVSVCPNQRNATENSNFACWVTANDTDELLNLTFVTNMSWFTFNNSLASTTENISSNTSAQINFTANDSMVGVWYINITVRDSGGEIDSETINFNISNIDDSVALAQPANSYDSYANAEFYLNLNASDEDLRIPSQGRVCDSGCYNESLTFSKNITNLTGGIDGINTTLFNLVKNSTAGNLTDTYIRFTSSDADAGNYTINITVRDANNYSISSKIFNLTVHPNNAPYWINVTTNTFEVNDGSIFTLNLSQNVTDSDGDSITFSDNTALFAITSAGNISFLANDSDVNTYNVNITLTDARGAINATQNFTFIVHNVEEPPILYFIENKTENEDSPITINFSANDEDLSLPSSTENITWYINSTNPRFSITKLNFNIINAKNAYIRFTPNKTDVGQHLINISINDTTGRMDSQEFNLTVIEINHPPVLDAIGSRNTTINQTFYLDINATDLENGMDNITANNNFTFFSNESWFVINSTTGVVSLTLATNNYVGYHWINITVGDLSNTNDSEVFRFTVYSINEPPSIDDYFYMPNTLNTVENLSTGIRFQVNATDPNAGVPNNDTLTFQWTIDGIVNRTDYNITSGTWNNWTYYANFTDEGARNITVRVSDTAGLNVSHSWNVTVNHSNAPIYFTGIIHSINATQSSSVLVTRNMVDGTMEGGGHFADIDHSDSRYNASINFTFNVMNENCTILTNLTTATMSVTNDTVLFSSSSTQEGQTLFCLNITGYDSNDSSIFARSNNFQVNLTVTPGAITTVPISSSGGGGGGAKKRVPVSLKIIVPEPVSMFTYDRIVVPIKLQNNGQTDLSGITLSAESTLEGIKTELDKNFFNSLLVGKEEKFDLTIITNTNVTGSYEITLNATVQSPVYSDYASFFVNLIEMGYKEKIKAQEKIVFLEELLIGNPECLELTELLNEAKKELANQNYKKSLELSEQAIQACKYAVGSKGKSVELKRAFDFSSFVLMSTILLLLFLFILFIYNAYRRQRFKMNK